MEMTINRVGFCGFFNHKRRAEGIVISDTDRHMGTYRQAHEKQKEKKAWKQTGTAHRENIIHT
jgi:hypothetical protein